MHASNPSPPKAKTRRGKLKKDLPLSLSRFTLSSVEAPRHPHPGTGSARHAVCAFGVSCGIPLISFRFQSEPVRFRRQGIHRRETYLIKEVTAMDNHVPQFPVSHKSICLEIKGIKTDLILCSYDDHFLVLATQIGSMGTILHGRKDEGVSSHPTFNVSVVLGKRDEPVLLACARQLIEHISKSGSSRSLVLSLGLKDHSVEMMKGVVAVVIENRIW